MKKAVNTFYFDSPNLTFLDLLNHLNGGFIISTSQYVDPKIFDHIFFALTPQNALICRAALLTGLRITDVLNITKKQIYQKSFTVTERKTGKKRVIRLNPDMLSELRQACGKVFVFEGRYPGKPKTRQAVYADLKRAAKAFRLNTNLSPHSLRKTYAVGLYKRTHDLDYCRRKLNHDDIATTLIYVMADELAERGCKHGKKK